MTLVPINPMANPIVHFEIPADDEQRAKKFYEKTFGWKIEPFKMGSGETYWTVFTTEVDNYMRPKEYGQINGGMMKRKNKGQQVMNYINVDSIDAMLQTIKKNGGEVCMPKTEISPGMGWIAIFRDTEGNMMGLHELAVNPNKKK